MKEFKDIEFNILNTHLKTTQFLTNLTANNLISLQVYIYQELPCNGSVEQLDGS